MNPMIKQWAEQAGISVGGHDGSPYPTPEQLQRFLDLAQAGHPDVLAKTIDTQGWQWEEKGKPYDLNDLSRGDLLQVACSCMETLEQVDEARTTLGNIMTRWRTGEAPTKNP